MYVGAQLPPLQRGLYYEGSHPGARGAAHSRTAFLERIHDGMHRDPGVDAEEVARAVFALLAARLPPAEVEDTKAATPRARQMNSSAQSPVVHPMPRSVRLFLCGDVMTGRGIDQVLPQPCEPGLHEDYVQSAMEYVELAEAANGPIPRAVGPAYVWGAALDELKRMQPDARVINLETSITCSEDYASKGVNYRMSPDVRSV